LTADRLRDASRHQVGILKETFEALDADPSIARVEPIDEQRRAGFLAIRAPHAGELSRRLRAAGVLNDFRGDVLRLGPAPYLHDGQLRAAVHALGEILRS